MKSEKLFNWLRKDVFHIKKPFALGLGEWDVWYENTKQEKPFAFFCTETLPDFIDKLYKNITKPYHDVRIYIQNRFVDKLHYLPTHLDKGKWHEFDTRLLYGMFGAFQDFVECELANFYLVMADKDERKKYNHTPFAKFCSFGFSKWRNPSLGLKYMHWYANEVHEDSEWLTDKSLVGTPTDHAMKYKRAKDLYEWWTIIRPNREDSYEQLNKFYADMIDKYGLGKGFASVMNMGKNYNKEEKARHNTARKRKNMLEKQYEKEDTKMMNELIEIRHLLWT